MTTTGSTYWDNRAASRANQPAQPDTSHYTLAAQNAEIDPTEQDYSPYAVVARRQAQRGLPVTPAPESYVPKVIGPAWTPPPGWVHSGDGWNPPGTPEGVRTPMPAGYETYRPDGSSTNTPYAAGTTSQAYNNAQTALGGTAAPWPVSTGGIGQSNYGLTPVLTPPPGNTGGILGTPPPNSSGGAPQLTPGQIAANNGSPGSTPATGILGTPGYTAAQLGTPEKWNVNKNQTVAGQIEGIIAADSPLQQLARTRAMQQQNDRGTLNTSMAIQAAQAANLDAALPIAQADAALQGRAAAYNADTANQFAGKNVDATNTALNTTAGINANTARDTAQTLANKATAEQLALTNRAAAEQQAIVNKNAAFEKAAADLRQSTANALNDKDVAAFKANLASAGLGQEQSILVSRELTTNINAIQARTDIDGPTKTAYIQDAVKRTNETLAVIGRATKIAGPLLQFTQVEDEPPVAPGTAPPPVAPPVAPPQQFGPNNRNGNPPD